MQLLLESMVPAEVDEQEISIYLDERKKKDGIKSQIQFVRFDEQVQMNANAIKLFVYLSRKKKKGSIRSKTFFSLCSKSIEEYVNHPNIPIVLSILNITFSSNISTLSLTF